MNAWFSFMLGVVVGIMFFQCPLDRLLGWLVDRRPCHGDLEDAEQLDHKNRLTSSNSDDLETAMEEIRRLRRLLENR